MEVRRRFIPVEGKHLLVAWLVLGVAFSAKYLFRASIPLFLFMLEVTLGTLGAGFVLHELAHKFTAQRYGARAEFRLWPWGLMMALLFAVMSGGAFVFAAPGATYIVPRSYYSQAISSRETGLTALAGPLTNVGLSGLFFLISDGGGLLGLVGRFGFEVNLSLAAFNLIPLGGLDGNKVLSWKLPIWAAVSIPTWALVAILALL